MNLMENAKPTVPSDQIIMRRFLTAFLLLICGLTGCTTHYSSADVAQGGQRTIYSLSEAQALGFIAATMTSSFPGREIKPLNGPFKGYEVYSRIALDTWTTTVSVIPVSGLTLDGKRVDGYRFDVSGGGSQMVSGRRKSDKFKNRLFEELAQSGTGVSVTSITPRL